MQQNLHIQKKNTTFAAAFNNTLMAIEIREVNTKRQLRQFIEFANDLYKDCPHYCPPLFFDEMNTFDEEKNPALQVCEKQLFMAFRDGKAVGRIAAIINRKLEQRQK